MHQYLAGTVKQMGGYPYNVGGVEDHVHMLVGLTPSHGIADFMRNLKSSASRWANHEVTKAFQWQNGYAAFSVSPDNRSAVSNYILKQPEHHKTFDFRAELESMLVRAGIKFDPKYLE